MKINSKHFLVSEGGTVNLKQWPTIVALDHKTHFKSADPDLSGAQPGLQAVKFPGLRRDYGSVSPLPRRIGGGAKVGADRGRRLSRGGAHEP